MTILQRGRGEPVGWHDPDDNRAWIREHKSAALIDKRTTVAEAVSAYIPDGSFLAVGGFGHVRVPMALIYEIVRQRRRHLTLAGKTAVHDCDILVASGCVDRVEVAYCFGHELRGLSPASRRAVETGACTVVGEISNAGYQWRFLAAMMGLPFIPTRHMLGTDTLAESCGVVIEDPFSGKPIALLPACYPDVAIFHVPRADKYGNAQIDGILVEDYELCRAARRVIVTTEEIVDEDVIRQQPWRTAIPYYVVDAVIEVPYGAHPCQMPYLYFFDEDHIAEWLEVSRTPEGAEAYFEKYVYGVPDFDAYLELVGGLRQMHHLRQIERLQVPMDAPWMRAKKNNPASRPQGE
jgi:3-oxoacid CoA-transferase subunit A/glutaconate CoA-transferase subunit A